MTLTFEVSVIGAGGGPLDQDNQSFLVRTKNSESLDCICIDGGVGMGQIVKMVAALSFRSRGDKVRSYYKNDWEPIDEFIDGSQSIEYSFSNKLENILSGPTYCECDTVIKKAWAIYNGIKEYYFTHAHMDHIAGFVLNTPLIFSPGPNKAEPSTKKLCGLHHTLKSLQNHVFNDEVWPDLLNDSLNKIKLTELQDNVSYQSTCGPTEWELTPFRVTHGKRMASLSCTSVCSTIYCISHKKTGNCIIIGGDFEYNEESMNAPGFNNLWNHLAKNVAVDKLKGIFVECSNTSAVSPGRLYGHLRPSHLINFLQRISQIYESLKNSIPQNSIKVIVTHVKMELYDTDPRLSILNELRQQAEEKKMNYFKFSLALQGYTYYL